MKNIVKSVIETGRFELSEMLRKIDTLWLQGNLTDDEKVELVTLAQGGAKLENSVDIIAKLVELEQRVKTLEDGNTTTEGDASEGGYPEYVAGKWYYSGDCISFEGKNYICIAPNGAVCTWNPSEYPAYWQEA